MTPHGVISDQQATARSTPDLDPTRLADLDHRPHCPACLRRLPREKLAAINGWRRYRFSCTTIDCAWAQTIGIGPDGVARTLRDGEVPPPMTRGQLGMPTAPPSLPTASPQPATRDAPRPETPQNDTATDREVEPVRTTKQPQSSSSTCLVPACDRADCSRGLCDGHYYRWRSDGKPADVQAWAANETAIIPGQRRKQRARTPAGSTSSGSASSRTPAAPAANAAKAAPRSTAPAPSCMAQHHARASDASAPTEDVEAVLKRKAEAIEIAQRISADLKRLADLDPDLLTFITTHSSQPRSENEHA